MAKFINGGSDKIFYATSASVGYPTGKIAPINKVSEVVTFPQADFGSFEFNLSDAQASFSATLTDELRDLLVPVPQLMLLVNGHELRVTYDPAKYDDGTYAYPVEYIGPAEHAPGAAWATKAYYEAVSHE